MTFTSIDTGSDNIIPVTIAFALVVIFNPSKFSSFEMENEKNLYHFDKLRLFHCQGLFVCVNTGNTNDCLTDFPRI